MNKNFTALGGDMKKVSECAIFVVKLNSEN